MAHDTFFLKRLKYYSFYTNSSKIVRNHFIHFIIFILTGTNKWESVSFKSHSNWKYNQKSNPAKWVMTHSGKKMPKTLSQVYHKHQKFNQNILVVPEAHTIWFLLHINVMKLMKYIEITVNSNCHLMCLNKEILNPGKNH